MVARGYKQQECVGSLFLIVCMDLGMDRLHSRCFVLTVITQSQGRAESKKSVKCGHRLFEKMDAGP